MIADSPRLTTDYLNHFVELVMLLEMLPDLPEAIGEVTAWRPRSYLEHIEASRLRHAAALRADYGRLERRRLRRLEETSAAANRLGQTIVEILKDPNTPPTRLAGVIEMSCIAMRAHIVRLGAIFLHKTDAQIDTAGGDVQSEIDALLAAAT